MWSVALENVDLLDQFTNTDLNMKDKLGYTALHIATANNSINCLKSLLAMKADLNIQNKHGETALIIGEEHS